MPEPPAALEALIQQSVLLDIEVEPGGRILKIGAVRGDQTLLRQGRFGLDEALSALQRFAEGAAYVIGHNLLGHDLPHLQAAAPHLRLLERPVVDTLYLSPIAFPTKPYHALVKDYQLVRDSLPDPLKDCRLAARVLREQGAELARRSAAAPQAVAALGGCFRGADLLDGAGLTEVLEGIGGRISDEHVAESLLSRWRGKACASVAPDTIREHLASPRLRPPLAYAAAWLDVAGGDSVLRAGCGAAFRVPRGC